MPMSEINEVAFLTAVCSYRLGNLNDAAGILRSCTNLSGYDYAATTYLRARAQGATNTEVAQVLGKLCQPHIANKVLDDFSDPKTVLSKVYPVCQNLKCEKCLIPCYCKRVEEFYMKLIEFEIESGIGSEKLAELFN